MFQTGSLIAWFGLVVVGLAFSIVVYQQIKDDGTPETQDFDGYLTGQDRGVAITLIVLTSIMCAVALAWYGMGYNKKTYLKEYKRVNNLFEYVTEVGGMIVVVLSLVLYWRLANVNTRSSPPPNPLDHKCGGIAASDAALVTAAALTGAVYLFSRSDAKKWGNGEETGLPKVVEQL